MTLEATVYALHMPEVGMNGEVITAVDLLVMLILSDCHDPDYPTPFPDVSWLARQTRMSTEELVGVLQGLEAKGMLSVFRRALRPDLYSGYEYAFPGLAQPKEVPA
jgi:hypothetical protein